MERWPNKFTLRTQTEVRSIVIRFLITLPLHKLVSCGTSLAVNKMKAVGENGDARGSNGAFPYEPVTPPAPCAGTTNLSVQHILIETSCLPASV